MRIDEEGVGGALGWTGREGDSNTVCCARGGVVGGGRSSCGGTTGAGIGAGIGSGSRSSSSKMSASGGRLFLRRRRPFLGGVDPAACGYERITDKWGAELFEEGIRGS